MSAVKSARRSGGSARRHPKPETTQDALHAKLVKLATELGLIAVDDLWEPLGIARSTWYDHLKAHPEIGVVLIGRRKYLSIASVERLLG